MRKRLARLVIFLNDPADTHFGHVDKWLDRRRILSMSPQSENVLFEQSRNVLLTACRLGRWQKDNY